MKNNNGFVADIQILSIKDDSKSDVVDEARFECHI